MDIRETRNEGGFPKAGRHITVRCDVWDVVEALRGDSYEDREEVSHSPYRNTWAGGTLEEAREYAAHGWESGAEALTDARDPLTVIDEVPSFEYGLAEEGAEPDIAAYLAGEELNMGDMRALPMPKPLVRIGVDMSVSHTVEPDEMLRVGASVFAVVERLRASGFPTAVDVIFAVDSPQRNDKHPRCEGGHHLDVILEVQSADRPVHAGLIAFFAAHPMALRRALFAICERALDMPTRIIFGMQVGGGGGYGRPNSVRIRKGYDEWAPSANMGEAAVTRWVAEVIDRRS